MTGYKLQGTIRKMEDGRWKPEDRRKKREAKGAGFKSQGAHSLVVKIRISPIRQRQVIQELLPETNSDLLLTLIAALN